jgi:hypothetical protein
MQDLPGEARADLEMSAFLVRSQVACLWPLLVVKLEKIQAGNRGLNFNMKGSHGLYLRVERWPPCGQNCSHRVHILGHRVLKHKRGPELLNESIRAFQKPVSHQGWLTLEEPKASDLHTSVGCWPLARHPEHAFGRSDVRAWPGPCETHFIQDLSSCFQCQLWY